MDVVQETWSASMSYERKHRIDLEPVYQRSPVWRTPRQQRLIDSMLRNYDIPKIYLTRLRSPRGDYLHEVTDGQQRLRAIWGFLGGEYPLGTDSEDVPDFGDLSGKYVNELPENALDRVKLFRLSIAELRDANEQEVRELFLRLQEGESLSPAEKRNAILGGMRDFIAMLGEGHIVFPLTHISSDRFGWHNLAAHVVCLELAEGPTDLKAGSLRAMYEEWTTFTPSHPAAQRTVAVLDFMAHVLRGRPDEMRIKWGFVDLYLSISQLLNREGLRLH